MSERKALRVPEGEKSRALIVDAQEGRERRLGLTHRVSQLNTDAEIRRGT